MAALEACRFVRESRPGLPLSTMRSLRKEHRVEPKRAFHIGPDANRRHPDWP
jgi:hypothetical protein